MSDYLPDLLFCFVLFGPIPSGVVAVSSLAAGSYLRRATKSKMVFLAPISMAVFVVTLFVWLVGMGVVINIPHFFSLDWQSILSRPNTIAGLITAGIIVAGIYWGVIFWYQKTLPLVLDLERRTYRTINSANVRLRVQTGSWEDISGIYVRRTRTEGNTIFYVRLKWKNKAKLYGALGGFSQRERAEAYASRMAAELHLPIVAAPDLAAN